MRGLNIATSRLGNLICSKLADLHRVVVVLPQRRGRNFSQLLQACPLGEGVEMFDKNRNASRRRTPDYVKSASVQRCCRVLPADDDWICFACERVFNLSCSSSCISLYLRFQIKFAAYRGSGV